MGNSEIQEILQAMECDLDAQDVDELFELIDTDGSGSIQQQEFIEGFTKMNGAAKSKDLYRLQVMAMRGQPLQVAKGNEGRSWWCEGMQAAASGFRSVAAMTPSSFHSSSAPFQHATTSSTECTP